jgi:hypothetical protein
MRRRAINQDVMTFAEKIKELLKQKEISQAEFCRRARRQWKRPRVIGSTKV